jgi:regulator of protease activity HflC (stomatin/prohibitin superfamily)
MGKGQIRFTVVGIGIIFIALIIIFLIGTSMSLYSVPEGSVGVMFHSFGPNQGFDKMALNQGWGFKMPFRDRVYTIPFRTQSIAFLGSETPGQGFTYGSLQPKDKNGITFDVDILVRYHLDPTQAPAFVEQKGEGIPALESILSTAVRADSTRGIFGQYAQEDVPQQRTEIAQQVVKVLQERIDAEASRSLKQNFIVIEAVDIRNVKFNQQIEDAIVNKQKTKQVAEQKLYELQQAETERNITLVQADRDRQAAILRANGDAAALLAVATAKAKGIELVNTAYQGMPPSYVQVKWAEAIQPTDKIIIGLDSVAKQGNSLGVINYNDLIAGKIVKSS